MGFLNSLKTFFIGAPERVLEPPKLPAPMVLGPSTVSRTEEWLKRELDPFSATRIYDAAIPRPYTADWQGWATSGSYEVLNAWRRVCYLARDLERNNSHCVAFLRELRNNVLGSTGIRPHPRVMLQKGNRLNKTLCKEIKTEWNLFRRRGNYEVTGLWSGQTCDELALQRMAVDGGVLLRLHRGYANRWRFAVQLIEVDALDLWYNTTNVPTGNRVTTGVETDKLGRPAAYWLLDFYEADLFANQYTGQRVRVPANELIHLWLPSRITSVRGVSWFTPAMIDLRMLGKYEEACVISARNSAAKMGFYEKEKDSPKYEGQGSRPDGSIIEEITPGLISELPAGYKFKPFDPGQPSDMYPHFRKNILRSICSGLGSMYNTVGNDAESVNYSSARFAKETENENWKILQRFLSEQLEQAVFDAWLECAVLAGAIQTSFTQIDAIKTSMTWRPRGYSYIDPQKDSQASLGNIDGGLSTRRKELADLGLDYDEFLDEVEDERDDLEARGIVFTNPYSKKPEVESSLENPAVEPGISEEAAKEQAQATPMRPGAVKPNGAKNGSRG